MGFKFTILAALAALSSAHPSLRYPVLEARQSSNTTSSNGTNSSVTAFVNKERSLALTGAIANIGGTNNSVVLTGVHNQTGNQPLAGVVVASPSTYNPDYYYSWTRDSALTMMMLVDELLFGTNTSGTNSLQLILEDYLIAQATLQTMTNPSGTFIPAGQNLGEPKFYTNLTRFDGTWGRPQNDGPALRATTLMELSYGLLAQGGNASQTVLEVIWPVILNDLKYVGQYWNTTGYDLWEEVNGNSFFTTTAQHRALAQGSLLAKTLNTTCAACSQASEIQCFLTQNFWNASGNYILANINANQVNRSQINCDPILAAMHNFDVNAPCNSAATQPCNSRILATHKVWVDSFRNLYPINNNATAPNAVLTGRYPEDTYYTGNPWFITTLAAAEVLYDAVAQMTKAGSYAIDNTSLPFFQDIYSDAEIATYQGAGLSGLTSAMTAYADGFVALVQNYTIANGSLSEQINKTTGEQTSASALTWSFAAFVTMAQRRAGQYPISWGANSTASNATNATCVWSSYNSTGTYVQASYAPQPAPYNSSTGCLTEVIFYVDAPTQFGQNVYIAGNNVLFNNSLTNPNNTDLPLHTGNITASSPTWYVPLYFPAGTNISYLYVLQNSTYNNIAENITRTVSAGACGASAVRTNDTLSIPS